MPSVIVTNVACVFLLVFLTLINVSKTSTRTTVQFAEKICSHHASRLKICLAAMQSTRIVSANLLALTIVVQSARRPLFRNNPWQLHGRRGQEI